jgi:hypothetical protein
MAQRCAKVSAFDELEREVVLAIGDSKVEHPSDVAMVQQRRQPRLTEKHGDEVGVIDERGQDTFEANALLEVSRPASDRDERLGHAPDTQPLD